MGALRRFWRRLGPGFVTGMSDNDSSGIATYTQVGAAFGTGQLWAPLFTFPLMAVVQEICGRIGLVSGRGIAAVVKAHYGRRVLWGAVTLLVVANVVNIGADLGAMAAAAGLVLPLPVPVLLIAFTLGILALEVLIPYRQYAKILKWLTLAFLAYVATAFIVGADWGALLLATIVPKVEFSSGYLLALVAFLGTTISPYLFFWQADEEVEEEVAHHRLHAMGEGTPTVTGRAVRAMRRDTVIGMFLSNLIAWFIMVTAAATLHANGITNIETADQAAQALVPLAGPFTAALFALGIVGAGLLGVPVLAGSASYAVAEAAGWREGLSLKFRRARGFYGVLGAATLIGLFLNFLSIPPFKLLYYAAALNGLLAPPLLVLILLVARRADVLGKYRERRGTLVAGWLTVAVMAAAGIGLIISFV
ncbi:MAG: divalent metal cation transporter [bacterium]|nr:divalent metal cation transporter [bacterium]